MHGDLCVPITPANPSGKKYFLLLVDDATRFMWLSLLTSKDEAPAAIIRLQAELNPTPAASYGRNVVASSRPARSPRIALN